MAISMARAKALCSASELALVKASSKQEIGTHTTARLKQKQARARKLRDKWRDQVASQQRKGKAGAAGAADNKNSAEKAALFDEVVARFTAQLEKAEAAGKTPGPMGRRRSTKTSRSRTHRASRAEVRGTLAEKKRTLKSRAGKATAETAPTEVEFEEVADSAEDAQLQPASKPRKAKPPIGTHASALEAGRKVQGLHVTKQGQLAARTAAKQDRLKASGMIRIQKNRSAANKRKQGKRDSR